ncbi:MAG: carbohydrate kinase family protein [Clostridia bacterium]|nr:carbohydrate kinase family protein [Clostridia bacterium]
MAKTVAGVGRLNVDLIYQGLPRLPEEGEEVYTDGFYMGLGGGIPGSLVSLARLGVSVRLGTWLGNDYVSDFARARLAEEGIVPTNLYRGETIPVNVTSAMITPKDRTFVTFGSVASEADSEDVYHACRGTDFVLMQLGCHDAYRKLKQEGATLLLDPGYDSGMTLEKYADSIALADWYLPNRKEALTITAQTDYREAAVVLSQFTGNALVKLDGGGAYLYQNGKGSIIPTVPAVRKDSTGAGDAFLAGFVYALSRGFCVEVAVMCGNIAGANCVSDYGCLSAKLTEADMAERLAEYYNIKI